MNRQGFTFIELMIVVFVIGILAAVGISKYQSFVIESRQKACMSQQKALDQAFAVWETKNTPVPADDGAYQFIHPLTGGPLSGETNSSHRFRWDATAVAYVIHDGDKPETKAVLPSGSAMARLVADEKLFACTELVKRAGGAEFIPVPALTGPAADNPNSMANNAPVTYQFYKAPTVATTTATEPGGYWAANNAALSNLHLNYVPDKVRRAIICRGYAKDHTGLVGTAYTITTTAVPNETIAFINGAGPDGTRETLHQSWLLQ